MHMIFTFFTNIYPCIWEENYYYKILIYHYINIMSVANILTIDGKLNVPVITDNITTTLLFSDNLTSPIINTNTINLTSSSLTIKNIDGLSIANLDDNTFNVISQELKCASLYCAGGSTYIDTNGLLTNTLYVSSIKPSGTSIFIKKSNG